MANRLSVAEVQSILTLHERGWSCRKIARELGLHRETVSNYVREARVPEGAKPGTAGTAPMGSGGNQGPKPATAPIGSEARPVVALAGDSVTEVDDFRAPGRARLGHRPSRPGGVELRRSASGCQPYREQILAKLEQGLSAVRIHQDLAADHPGSGDVPSYYSVRRYVARLGAGSGGSGGSGGSLALPFRRMECAPAMEAQVDFGQGAPIAGADGRRRRPHVLRVVLSHSRKGYSEVVERQSTENFIRCLENAFFHFGGVPQTLVLDNLRAAVAKADWFDPEINPKVQSFCAHYGIVALPTRPYTPRHKGKVERGVAYVQDNALKGHVFAGLEEQNRHLAQWEKTVADTRLHGTTRQQVAALFAEVERPALRPLPASGGRFPFFHEGRRSVHRDGHVEVEKAYYSVPPEYLGRIVWVRWDGRLVRVFDQRMHLVATHVRQEPGRFSTQDRHILDEKINAVERGAAWLLQQAAGIGTQAQRWAEAMIQARGIEGVRVLQGLLNLAGKHPGEQLDQACGVALEHGCFRLRTIRQLLGRQSGPADQQAHFDFLDEHPIIRPLSDYGRFVHEAILQPLPGVEN